MEKDPDKKPVEKKPAVSAEEIVKALSKATPQAPLEKNYAPGEGFDWSPDEEEATLKRWLSGEELLYEGDPEKGSSE